jgi:hypothetical protein
MVGRLWGAGSIICSEVFRSGTHLNSEVSDLVLSLSCFVDVIGQIVSVEEMGETWKWKTWRNISFRNVRLHDLR